MLDISPLRIMCEGEECNDMNDDTIENRSKNSATHTEKTDSAFDVIEQDDEEAVPDKLDTAFDVVEEPEEHDDHRDEKRSDGADPIFDTDGGDGETIFDDDVSEGVVSDKDTSDNSEEQTLETAASDVVMSDDIFTDDTYTDDEPAEKGKKTHKGLKIFGIVMAAVVICTYVAISVWFLFHYNYKTYINGVDYSFYTIDDVDSYIKEYISGYSLTLKTLDGSEYVIRPEDIALNIQPSVTAKKIINEQNGFLWPYYMLQRKDYELRYSADYNTDMLKDILHSYDFTDESKMEKPVDAYVTIEDGKAVIIPESDGNYLDFEKLCSIIDEAIIKGDSVLDLADTDVYDKAEVTADSDELKKEQSELEKMLGMTITYEIDQISWKLTSEDYGDWIINDDGKWKFSEDKVREYVSNIAGRYDTYGVPRNFSTHDGRVITLANTWYGWLIDEDSETQELMSLLEAGESVSHTPEFSCYAAVYRDGGDDIGNSYVECDFGQQHVYAYVDGNLVWDSDCVTGSLADNGKYRTPEGVYTILYTKSPAVLIGDDYETPVKYWMPFIGELGIGFHDASWRSSFGGDIYKSGGSHGCVNLPVSAAEQLFNIVYDGMPVICYY